MKKLVAIVAGTRPEAIKMAPIHFALGESESIQPVFLATAQHRHMLDQTLEVFEIQPDFDLNLMKKGQSLADLTSRTLSAVSKWCDAFRPSAILVQGDTTTVLASALAAFYARVPVGHIEAGLRTGNMASPFPEEMNRRLTSPVTRWHFCPTDISRDNLAREGIHQNVYVTGNTVVDALLRVCDRLQKNGTSVTEVAQRTGIPENFRSRFLTTENRFILVTGHRRESFGDGFERICQSIARITEIFPDVGVLYPVHLNPQVQEPVQRLLGSNPNIALIEPVSYQDFVWLMHRCTFLLSDSGGVQEEAPTLGKPVLIMRDTTERPEGVNSGTCRLVGTCVETICRESSILLNDPAEYAFRSQLRNPYGDGLASIRIRKILESELNS